MCQAKPKLARPVQDHGLHPSAPTLWQRLLNGLEALDQMQPWSTRRVRIACLNQLKSRGA